MPADGIYRMVASHDCEFARLALDFHGLGPPPLHASDCQGLFCELDKYCREAGPGLASARKRIKMRFKPMTAPIDLFFPPKWGLAGQFPLPDTRVRSHNRTLVQGPPY